jgi:hypothetical protein
VPIGYELLGDDDVGGNWQVSASGVRRVKFSKVDYAPDVVGLGNI